MIAETKPPERESESDYHARSEVSRSDLALFRESRARFRAIKDGRLPGIGQEKGFHDDLDLGTAAHLLLLEPERFLSEVAAWSGTRAGPNWKRFQREQVEAGRMILKEKDWWLAAVAAGAVRGRMGKLIDNRHARREQSHVWTETVAGEVDGERVEMRVECRSRHDLEIVVPAEAWTFDVKTTGDINLPAFRKEIRNRGYWLQDSHYSSALMAEYGLTLEQTHFIFIPVGKRIAEQVRDRVMDDSAEFGQEQLDKAAQAVKGIEHLMCGMVELEFSERQAAMSKWRELLWDYARCVETGDWSDPGEGEVKTVSGVVS